MPESISTRKPIEPGGETPKGSKSTREYDAEFNSLLSGVRIMPNAPAEGAGVDHAGQTLNVTPPPPELVSRLVKFIKKI